jgi:DNA-binding XRE family transcriptional regulator
MATMTAPTRRRGVQGSPHHDQRLARRLAEDPEFRAEFKRQQREIAVIDGIVNKLDALRAQLGLTKAELARTIGKNPASIRRLLTASGNPELRTVVAMADALGAEVKIVPKRRAGRKSRRRSSASRRRLSARAHA